MSYRKYPLALVLGLLALVLGLLALVLATVVGPAAQARADGDVYEPDDVLA